MSLSDKIFTVNAPIHEVYNNLLNPEKTADWFPNCATCIHVSSDILAIAKDNRCVYYHITEKQPDTLVKIYAYAHDDDRYYLGMRPRNVLNEIKKNLYLTWICEWSLSKVNETSCQIHRNVYNLKQYTRLDNPVNAALVKVIDEENLKIQKKWCLKSGDY